MDRRTALQRYRDGYLRGDRVRELEQLAEEARPPLVTLEVDGWVLRTARGFGWHGNAVWPRVHGDRLDVARKITAAERFYRQRGLPPCVRISPTAQPSDLDRVLAARGYARTPSRTTLVAEARRLTADRSPLTAEVRLETEPTERWVDRWTVLTGSSPADAQAMTAVLRRVRQPSLFASVVDDGAPVAVARGVVHDAWLSVWDLEVDALRAADGLASAMVFALAVDPRARGVERVGWTTSPQLPAAPAFRAVYEHWFRHVESRPMSKRSA